MPIRFPFVKMIVAVAFATFYCGAPLLAQQGGAPAPGSKKELAAQTIYLNVLNLPHMVEYQSWKTETEQRVYELGNNPSITYEEQEQLKTDYNNSKLAFDIWVDKMVADLVDFKTIQSMSKTPLVFANKYLSAYDSARRITQNGLEQRLNSLEQKYEADNKVINPVLIEMGVDVTLKIVNYFITRKQGETQSAMVALSEELFGKRLRFRGWKEIVKYSVPKPQVAQGNPVPAKAHQADVLISHPSSGDKLSGSLQVYMKPGKKSSSKTLSPVAVTGKDGFVEESGPASTQGSVINIETEQQPADSFRYQLLVSSDCYVYVFFYQSSETCYPVYPFFPTNEKDGFVEEEAASPVMSRGVSVNGQDSASHNLWIPRQRPGASEPFMGVSPDPRRREQVVIIFSRSLLNLNDIMANVEQYRNSGYTLEQKLHLVFGSQMISAASAGVNAYSNGVAQPDGKGSEIRFSASSPASNAIVVMTLDIPYRSQH